MFYSSTNFQPFPFSHNNNNRYVSGWRRRTSERSLYYAGEKVFQGRAEDGISHASNTEVSPFEAFSCQRSFQQIKTRALDAQWTGSFITKDHLFVRPLKETYLWMQIAQIPTQHLNKCSNVRQKMPVSSYWSKYLR